MFFSTKEVTLYDKRPLMNACRCFESVFLRFDENHSVKIFFDPLPPLPF